MCWLINPETTASIVKTTTPEAKALKILQLKNTMGIGEILSLRITTFA